MSNHDKIAKLKEYIKNYVIKELEKDEELDEVSTTATAGIDGTGTGHYDTPRAFSSGSAVGHKSPEVGGYEKIKESSGFTPYKDVGKKTQIAGGIVNHWTRILFNELPVKHRNVNGIKKALRVIQQMYMVTDHSGVTGMYRVGKRKFMKDVVSKMDKLKESVGNEDPKILQKINESYTRMFIEIGKAINASKADDLNAIKDLGEEYDIGRVLYMARTNPKALKTAVSDRVKEKKQFLTKTKKLKEVTKQEVNALRNLVKGIGNLKKDFSKATYIGDKELRKKDYNKHYETLLGAEKAMVKLMQLFKNKEMLGEGRYHDWRNDESMTPKQKVGKSMREIRDALNELDKTVKMNLKLKTELNMKSEDYWKNTHKALTKISERLVKMANKVGNLK
jgi:hypothetical protein